MNSRTFPYLLVAITSIALSFLYCPPYDIYFDDKEIFKYTGFLIKKGEVPYKDFFDHKPPLIFFINFFGSLIGSWGLWIIDALLVLYASLMFLSTNIKHKVMYPVVLPIVFNLILRNSTISFGIGMTREYTTILLLIAFCIIINQIRWKYFYIGLLAAMIFLFQQEQIILLIPFLIYSLICDAKTSKLRFVRSFSLLVAGVVTVVLPIVLYFLFNNALEDFWHCAFVFNTQWYTTEIKPGLIQEAIVLKNFIYDLKFEIVFIGALLMGIISLVMGNQKKVLLLLSLLCIPLSFVAELLSGKLAIGNASTTYYLLPLAATLPFTLFLAFAFDKNHLFQNKVHQFIYSALFLINLALNVLVYVVNYSKYPQDGIAKSKELAYLKGHRPVDFQLYIFNESNFIYAYNSFAILPPSKWLYHYFWNWYPSWDEGGEIISSITSDLKRHQTRYIIFDPDAAHFRISENNRIWNSFLDSFYNQVPGMKLWELKGQNDDSNSRRPILINE